MRKFNLLYLLWFLLAGSLPLTSQAEEKVTETPKASEQPVSFDHPGAIDHPEWFKVTFYDLKEDVAEAAEAGKRVILYFYQDGCPYCKKLIQENLGQRRLAEKTQQHFDFIAINMWGNVDITWTDGKKYSQSKFAEHMQVMFTPTLLFLDEEGKIVGRVNGYYEPHKFEAVLDYIAGKKEKEMSFRDFYASVSPVPASGKIHQELFYLQSPYRLQSLFRLGKKPLMVMFEQKQCKDCDELHMDILKRKESIEQLERFDVAVLDMWSDEKIIAADGAEITMAEWAKKLNITNAPSIVFFDAEGNEVFRTEAYLKAFHMQSAMDYVASRAYVVQSSFQRFISERATNLEALGIHVDIMK
ncbi:MAG: thioredoxin fold domain-containing protein [Gammaproteobacteria bacterium]|nr:thioredoxin fold domain-containing protein [Gammaproteobacteria bacterium]MDH5595001.1 thioredoxin fold domain-containing protein [Gammaproteobacteria bacterium]